MDYKKYTWIAGGVALISIAFAAIALGVSDFKSWEYPLGQATVSVIGKGEVTALPDIATVIGDVREEAKTVPEAQKAVEAKIKEALASVSALGIEKKDVKTLSYIVNPKYENQNNDCFTCPIDNGKVIGYEVSETIQIKIRKIELAGDVFEALGKVNVSDMSGPEFTVDNMDKPEAEARGLAVKNAEEKAQTIAKSLGRSIGEVLDFSEDLGGGGESSPMYSLMKTYGDGFTLPSGGSVIKSSVTLTYSLD